MKKQIKGFAAGVVCTLLLGHYASAGEIKETIEVYFNKINIEMDGKPLAVDNILYKGTTYVPLRPITEVLGKELAWDQDSSTASIVSIESKNKPKGDYSEIVNMAKKELDSICQQVGNIDDRSMTEKTLKNFKENSKLDLESLYFGEEETGKMYLQPTVQLPEDYDPRKRPWYGHTKDQDYYYSDTYIDVISGTEILTISKAVYKEGKFLGVAGMDIAINRK